ncbi:response regulator [Pontibacter harenae]|uniref:response regulator n=1 Tax=Pontibacter harenae TaxID=2894083 RepID=UPI001E28BF86|nr:response regulator [Pontibacter harenae]MCC9167874.1 response regulator [Pontibacter harenae]
MKIFIVDNDHISNFLVESMMLLEDAALDISIFMSGTRALEALRLGGNSSVPDLILLDLDMPVMDGWDFLDAMATHTPKLYKKCSIYILTSSLDSTYINRVVDYPMVSGIIQKPAKAEEMRQLVQKVKRLRAAN